MRHGWRWRAPGALLPGPLLALLQRCSAQMGSWVRPRGCQPHLQDAPYVIYLRTTHFGKCSDAQAPFPFPFPCQGQPVVPEHMHTGYAPAQGPRVARQHMKHCLGMQAQSVPEATLRSFRCVAPADTPEGSLPSESCQLLLESLFWSAGRPGRWRRTARLLVLLLVPSLGRCELPVPVHMQSSAFSFLKACELVQAGFSARRATSCCILMQLSVSLMQHTCVCCKTGAQQNIPVMEVPGASFGRLLGILHSAAPALACHNFIGLLDFDKALRCLGALQIWMVPAGRRT